MAYVTFPDETLAAQICEDLVRDGVIACGNVFPPHRAIYKWKDYLENHSECAVVLKLAALNKQKLMERIRAVHPYETPALVFVSPDDGLPEYIKWICEQSR